VTLVLPRIGLRRYLIQRDYKRYGVWGCLRSIQKEAPEIELRFSVSLDTKLVISETLFPANKEALEYCHFPKVVSHRSQGGFLYWLWRQTSTSWRLEQRKQSSQYQRKAAMFQQTKSTSYGSAKRNITKFRETKRFERKKTVFRSYPKRRRN